MLHGQDKIPFIEVAIRKFDQLIWWNLNLVISISDTGMFLQSFILFFAIAKEYM
jgi:hypothetical protein